MGLSVLRLRVGQCLTWARWHLAPFLFGWNKEWDAQKLMIRYWSFFADPQFKEEICGRLCHHCITKFCRPQNSKLKMGDQDPLHMATDGQEDSQTEFEIPHWSSFVVLHRFFLSLVSNSNSYLTSTGYTDGGDMYSHQVERTSWKWNNWSLVRWISIGLHYLSCLCPTSVSD